MNRLHGLILGAIAGAIIQSAGSSEACPEIKIPVLGKVIYSTCARVPTIFAGAVGATKGTALGYVGVVLVNNLAARKKLRPVNPLTGTDYEEFDWDILGYTSLGAIFLSVSFSQPVKTITAKIKPQTKPAINTKIANLFDTPRSLGSLAICHSEGNCLADGTKTSRYGKHVDPGDLKINGGYCSTSFARQGKKGTATLAALEKLCKEENQADAKIIYNAFVSFGLKPEQHLEAFINGVDFANQARNEHAVQFVADYSRNPSKSMGELRTQSSYLKLTGLHFACRNWTKQTKQAVGVTNVRSPQEKWRCVHYDQTRRAQAIIAVLDYHQNQKTSQSIPRLVNSSQFAFPVEGGSKNKHCNQPKDSRGWLPQHSVGCISYLYLQDKNHYGIDINAPLGTPVLAAANGLVVKAGWNDFGLGNRIIIKHLSSLETIYGHNSALFVKPGDRVTKGQKIAAIGNTGSTKAAQTGDPNDGHHLHFEVLKNDNWSDPMKYF